MSVAFSFIVRYTSKQLQKPINYEFVTCKYWYVPHIIRFEVWKRVVFNSLRPSDVGKLTNIGSDNGLSPGRRQAILWINTEILLTGPLGTNFLKS